MSKDKRGFFAQVFLALMIFCGLVWIWTVAFIVGWPWEKSGDWQPDFRVVAVCGDKGDFCGIPYGELEDARAKGLFKTLELPGDAGERVYCSLHCTPIKKLRLASEQFECG